MVFQISWELISLRIFAIQVCLLLATASFSQHSSRDSFKGNWESSSSWDPEWVSPVRDSLTIDITINGYLTASGSISFANTPTTLVVNDTLVINGDLYLGNKNNLTINDNGILIVKGTLTISNKSVLVVNKYLIVSDCLVKEGSFLQGSATSNDNPVKVFIGGTVSSSISDNPSYPVFDTEPPFSTNAYPGSGDSFGNMTDLMLEPVYAVYTGTCKTKSSSANGPLCPGQTILLHAEGGTSYEWTGPGGFSSSLQDPSITDIDLSHAGPYSVSITEPFCPVEIKTSVVVINTPPAAGITCPDKVCAGEAITLGSSGGISSYWTGPNGFESDTRNPVIQAATTAMSGTYSVKVRSAENCTATATHNLTVNALPSATIITNSPVCSGEKLMLSCPEGTSFRWRGPSGFSSSLQNPVIENALPSLSGNYVVAVTNSDNCSSEVSAAVVINELPRSAAYSNSPVCYGDAVLLSSSGGSTFKWTGPSGFSADVANPSIPNADMAKSGTYEVTVTSGNNCSSKASVQVVVSPLPDVKLSVPGDHICTGDNLTLTGIPDGGVYNLKTGPGAIDGKTYSSTIPGQAVLEYSYTDGCKNIVTQLVNVVDRPVANPGDDQLLNYIFETNLNADLPPGMKGKWSLVSGAGIFENENSPATPVKQLAVGENIFRLTVSNDYCEESREVKIIVEDLFLPSVITPNNDGRNDFFVTNTPGDGIKLTIFNRWGKIVFKSADYKNDWDGKNSEGGDLPEDTYFYIIETEMGFQEKET